MGRGPYLHIHIFAWRVVFTWSFMDSNVVLSVEVWRKLLWACLDVLRSYNLMDKEAVFPGVMCFLKFIQGSMNFSARRIRVEVVEFLRSQQVEFLSNLYWKIWTRVERFKGLWVVKGDPSLGLCRLRGREMVEWN